MGFWDRVVKDLRFFRRKTEKDFEEVLSEVQQYVIERPRNEGEFLSLLALLLAKVVDADDNVSLKEHKRFIEILEGEVGLDHEAARLVADTALVDDQTQEIFVYEVADRLRRVSSIEQRVKVVELLYSLADEDLISIEEETLIKRIVSTLAIPEKSHERIQAVYDKDFMGSQE